MRVLVYEPDHRGHHFAYLAHLLPAIATLVDEVTLATTPSGAASPQFQLHFGASASQFTLDTSIGEKHRRNGFQYSTQTLRRLLGVARRLKPEHIYVPYGDGLAQIAGLAWAAGLRPFPHGAEAEVLLMRGGYQYPAEGRRRKVFNRIGPPAIDRFPWTRIHHLNPDDLTVLKRCAKQPDRYRLMPDPVEAPPVVTRSEARRRLNIPEDGRYVGCAGGIDRRKGMHLLVRAFLASTSQLRTNDRLLLAGPMEPEIGAIIDQEAAAARAAGRLVVIDRHLAAREVADAIAAMDVVATPYPAHFHSASIVIQAAACGRPVLGSSIGWMRRTVEEFQLGATCNVRDPDELSTQLIRSLETSEAYRPTTKAQRFVAFHSSANFRAHWMARLRERLNLRPEPNLITWESVTSIEQPGLVAV